MELTNNAYFKGFSKCYLWTFTFRDVVSKSEYRECWQKLQTYLRRISSTDPVYGGFHGIKAVELHPSGHGYHVHIITREKYDVNVIRPIAIICGWGRIHVKKIPVERSLYIGKYLSKQKRETALKGLWLWSKIRISKTLLKDLIQINTLGCYIKTVMQHLKDGLIQPITELKTQYQRFLYSEDIAMRWYYLGENPLPNFGV